MPLAMFESSFYEFEQVHFADLCFSEMSEDFGDLGKCIFRISENRVCGFGDLHKCILWMCKSRFCGFGQMHFKDL